ncbi:uncharacterized protein At4g04775-like [Capsella rubella]|uniref:uncharacterized protein At4g04775-like n=1 Tax=Capsella rubella TaxID=81985 RepID=UPI000CD506B8|nr:uncharacterized protein At4g04775-like [Capsella rubella]
MSNVSGASNSSSHVRGRGRTYVFGVPKRCWCGEDIVAKNSHSDANPCRRYVRCGYAYAKKLENDNHVFKWVDEALLDEVEKMKQHIGMVEKNVMVELEKKMVMEVEKELCEKVEDVKSLMQARMNKMLIGIVLGCMIMIGIVKLVG